MAKKLFRWSQQRFDGVVNIGDYSGKSLWGLQH